MSFFCTEPRKKLYEFFYYIISILSFEIFSPTCSAIHVILVERTTSGVVHARPSSSLPSKSQHEDEKNLRAQEMNKPFPLPVPFDYRVRRTGEQSLLILPQRLIGFTGKYFHKINSQSFLNVSVNF